MFLRRVVVWTKREHLFLRSRNKLIVASVGPREQQIYMHIDVRSASTSLVVDLESSLFPTSSDLPSFADIS